MEDFARVVQPFGGTDVFAAVFDGHGGDWVSRRASERLHEVLAAAWGRESPIHALESTFRIFGDEVADQEAGATAVVAVLDGETLTVANVGDSHALVVSEAGHDLITQNHRLDNREEYERVVAAGARIRGPYMCLSNGKGIVTTRAFGDAPFKRIGQISEPAITYRPIEQDDRWLVLASDGVWDSLTVERVAAIARAETTAEAAADRVLEGALADGSDNVSVVVVKPVNPFGAVGEGNGPESIWR